MSSVQKFQVGDVVTLFRGHARLTVTAVYPTEYFGYLYSLAFADGTSFTKGQCVSGSGLSLVQQ